MSDSVTPAAPGAIAITDIDYTVYDFGEKKIWPKPELKTPFDALQWHAELVGGVKRLEGYTSADQRVDHFIRNLDILAFALQESLFKTMVLRESITGFPTRRAEKESSLPAQPDQQKGAK